MKQLILKLWKYLMGSTVNLLLYIFILIIVIVLAWSQIQSCNSRKRETNNDDMATMLKLSRDSTKHLQNSYGEEIAYRRAVEGSLKHMEVLIGKDSIAQIAKRFKTQTDRLTQYLQVISGRLSFVPLAHQETVYDTIPVITDSCYPVNHMTGTFQNRYDTVVVRLGDSAYAYVKSGDTLDLVSNKNYEWKGLTKKWYTTYSVIGRNPDAHYQLSSVLKFYTEPKPKRWAVILYGGAGYNVFPQPDFSKPSGQIGIGVGRILFRF